MIYIDINLKTVLLQFLYVNPQRSANTLFDLYRTFRKQRQHQSVCLKNERQNENDKSNYIIQMIKKLKLLQIT